MNDKPQKTFRDGAVGASIWARRSERGPYYEVTFSRAWKSQDTEECGYSYAFRHRDLDALIALAADARAWIENAEQNAETLADCDTSTQPAAA